MKPIQFTEINGKKFLGFNVIIDRRWPGPYLAVVTKASKLWIMVRGNEFCTIKYSRRDGWTAGAFVGRGMPGVRMFQEHVDLLNKFADENGGTWDGGWRPVKRKNPDPAPPLNPRGRIPERMTDKEAKLADKALKGAEGVDDED